MEHGQLMPIVDQSLVESEWAELSATERAFERLSNSDLYRRIEMIQSFRSELKSYDVNLDAAYCNHRDRWITALEREEMQNNPMHKT